MTSGEIHDDQRMRDTIYDAVQSTHDTDDALDGSVLTAFVVVAEWSTPDGDRLCSVTTGDTNRDSLPLWTANGLLQYAVQSNLQFDDGDDD